MIPALHSAYTGSPEIWLPAFRHSCLRELKLSSNRLSLLPCLPNYTNLTTLFLHSNQIKEVDQSCLPPNLHKIQLDNNLIVRFVPTNMAYFERLINRTDWSLKLGGNPYECSCDSLDLYNFVTRAEMDDVALNCSKNITYKNGSLTDFCPSALAAVSPGMEIYEL